MPQKGFAPLLLLIGILIIGVVIGGVYYFKPSIFSPITKNSPRACTQEAKQCPDGSSVGRTGPNCEFSPCPKTTTFSTPDEIANWKTYTNTKHNFSFKYPPDWETQPFGSENPKYYGDGELFFTCSTSVLSTEVFDMAKYPSTYSDFESYLKIRGIATTPADLQTGKTIALGNEQAMYWEINGDPGSSNPSARSILFSKLRKIIIDLNIFNFCGKDLQQTSSTFNQILSTLKFN